MKNDNIYTPPGMTFADKALKYFLNLSEKSYEMITFPSAEFNGHLVNPYKDKPVKESVVKFFKKYFNDNKKRIYIFGINPGRFGGGLTGIAFTDPVALREKCKIGNEPGKRKELSSKFIYDIIERFGGVKNFYSKFFITALFPLAIVKDGKNYNYYDDKNLLKNLFPYLKESFGKQIAFGAVKNACICLGKRNYEYLKIINNEKEFFEEIITLEHPRYIMQYKMKDLKYYREKYLGVLKKSATKYPG
jgi:hypothetical protein